LWHGVRVGVGNWQANLPFDPSPQQVLVVLGQALRDMCLIDVISQVPGVGPGKRIVRDRSCRQPHTHIDTHECACKRICT